MGRLFASRFYKFKQSDIDNELKIMKLEKAYFGRYTLYPERQTKEYRKWLKQTINEIIKNRTTT